MPSYEYTCLHCNITTEEVVPYEERELQTCRLCNAQLDRHFPAPRVLVSSYPDGMKRPGWNDVREISKLKVQEASLSRIRDREEIGRIKKTMNELSMSAEKQIREKKPQEDIRSEKSAPSKSED